LPPKDSCPECKKRTAKGRLEFVGEQRPLTQERLVRRREAIGFDWRKHWKTKGKKGLRFAGREEKLFLYRQEKPDRIRGKDLCVDSPGKTLRGRRLIFLKWGKEPRYLAEGRRKETFKHWEGGKGRPRAFMYKTDQGQEKEKEMGRTSSRKGEKKRFSVCRGRPPAGEVSPLKRKKYSDIRGEKILQTKERKKTASMSTSTGSWKNRGGRRIGAVHAWNDYQTAPSQRKKGDSTRIA